MNLSSNHPSSSPKGNRFWRITAIVITLHTLLAASALGLVLIVHISDALHERSITLSHPPHDLKVDLPIWAINVIPLLVAITNTVAIQIASRRINGLPGFKRTVVYLISVVLLTSIYVTTFSVEFPEDISEQFIPSIMLNLPAILILTGVVLFRVPNIRKGHCNHCGYNLTGNTSGTCPECGSPITTPT